MMSHLNSQKNSMISIAVMHSACSDFLSSGLNSAACSGRYTIQLQVFITHLWTRWPKNRGLIPSRGKIFYSMASRLTLGPTRPPGHCIPGAVVPGRKWLAHEGDNLLPSSDEFKFVWNYTSTAQVRHMGNFTYKRILTEAAFKAQS
jgi:hypothetical protein